jgi:hypothetical protein
MERGYDR